MRLSPVLPALAVLVLGLSACDQTPKPKFAEKAPDAAEAPSEPSMAPAAQPAAPQTVAQANCCCCQCPPVQSACTPAKAEAKPAVNKAVHRPRTQPTAARPVRHKTPRYAERAPAPSQERQYRRYEGPDIRTQGFGAYEHGYQQGYAREEYSQHGYAGGYVQAPPPPQVYAYRGGHSEGGYSEHSRYSESGSGYAYSYGQGGGCCGPRPQRVEAAGRDAGGYLTWPGKNAPAPYY